MCGHDGHITSLLGGVSKILEHIDKIPEDKIIRLIFQPAEEDPGGALPMVLEGCMQNVDEIYGGHTDTIKGKSGTLVVEEGVIMAGYTDIQIIVI